MLFRLALLLSLVTPAYTAQSSSGALARDLKKKKKKKKGAKKKKGKGSGKTTPAPAPVTSAPVATPVTPATPAPVKATPAPVKETPSPTAATTVAPTKKVTPAPTKAPTKTPTKAPTPAPTACPPEFDCAQDRDACALVALFNALDGCNWTNRDGWFTSDTGTTTNADGFPAVCDWFGITCNTDGQVTRVNLYNNKLKGMIPSDVIGLVNLEAFEVGTNDISGTVPTAFGQLANLVTLLLDNNMITGTVPGSVCEYMNNQEDVTFWTDCDGPSSVKEVTCTCCTACLNSSTASPSAAPTDSCGGKVAKPIKEMYDATPIVIQSELSGYAVASGGWFVGGACNVCSVSSAFGSISCTASTTGGEVQALQFTNPYNGSSAASGAAYKSGQMPTSMSNMTKLVSVALNADKFKTSSGTLPSDLSKASLLQTLTVTNVSLIGGIPKLTINHAAAGPLDLSSNSFSGTIPNMDLGANVNALTLKENKKKSNIWF